MTLLPQSASPTHVSSAKTHDIFRKCLALLGCRPAMYGSNRAKLTYPAAIRYFLLGSSCTRVSHSPTFFLPPAQTPPPPSPSSEVRASATKGCLCKAFDGFGLPVRTEAESPIQSPSRPGHPSAPLGPLSDDDPTRIQDLLLMQWWVGYTSVSR